MDDYNVRDVLAEEGIDLSCYWWINTNVVFGNIYADLLFIDELKSDKSLTASQFEVDQLMYLISERHGNERPFIITTNMERREVFNIFGEAFYSRLADVDACTWIEFHLEDVKRNYTQEEDL